MTEPLGYFAAVVETLDQWQGYYLRETPSLRHAADTLKLFAAMSGSHPLGVLQAVIVESLLDESHARAAAAALALHDLTHESYFVIMGDKRPTGYQTEMRILTTTTVDAARQEIDQLPEVVRIKTRLLEKLARGGFH